MMALGVRAGGHEHRIPAVDFEVGHTGFLQGRQVGDDGAALVARGCGEALGPLHGVPITVKDHFALAGTASSCGMARLRGHVDAGRRLLGAGPGQ